MKSFFLLIKLVLKRSALTFVCIISFAHAQPYPNKPIKLVIPYAVGGGTDISTRVMSKHLDSRLNQSIIIENKGGAGSTIGTEVVVRSEPDGYTLLANTDTIVLAPLLFSKINFDIRKDLVPISFYASAPIVLVANPSFPAKDVKELIAYAKKNPGKVALATSGPGSPHDLAAMLFTNRANIEVNEIPYKGNGPALTDTIAGHVDIGMFTLSQVQPYAQAGKVKILAVISPQRTTLAPDIPSLAESGIANMEVSSRYLIMVPAKTPKAIIKKLEGSFSDLFTDKQYRSEMEGLGFEVRFTSPEDTAAILQKEYDKFAPILKAANFKPQ
ncbi:MAG: tripartite tricarboxylate transporter substrate binding protein [Polynucleobacter sp.]